MHLSQQIHTYTTLLVYRIYVRGGWLDMNAYMSKYVHIHMYIYIHTYIVTNELHI